MTPLAWNAAVASGMDRKLSKGEEMLIYFLTCDLADSVPCNADTTGESMSSNISDLETP